MQLLHDIGSSLKHLFFPHVCKCCYAEIYQHDHYICPGCLADLPYTGFSELHANPVEKIFFGRVPVEAATSLFFFTPSSAVQKLIHQIKYKGQQQLAVYLGKMMGREIRASPRFGGLDMVVPLPLFKTREKQRGYNQAALLARGISDTTGIPIAEKAVKRIRESSSQTRKTRAERWQNVDGLFTISEDLGKNKHILLVDDVITTGATLDACASSILRGKGNKVSIITLAYAMQ
jgi:ComF family protein